MQSPDPAKLCEQAIRLLEEALDLPPAELKAEVDLAERAIAALRDELIERKRAGQAHPALERVNVALSLVVGVEYAADGIPRDMLAQARDTLRALDDWPPR